MLNISYNLSYRLKEYLYKIENLRREIALTPISPKTKLKLRWDAMINRIYYSLKLSGNRLKKAEMVRLLGQNHKKMRKEEQEVIKYKRALDYILQKWLGANLQVDSASLIRLHEIIGSGKLSKPVEELEHLLDYLQGQKENAIIQAAIASIEIAKMQPFTNHNKEISLLAPYLFLYKYGYDFRRFLAYESEWENYKPEINKISLTLWLEYFAECILRQIEKVAGSVTTHDSILKDINESFFELNDRHKAELNYLDNPENSITNRKIQKNYKVSQITASRDLAKLTNLGFLLSHGKGRSVYYTKI